jgi:hypothetical protein
VTTSTLRRAIVAIVTLTAAIVGVTTSTVAAADFTVRAGGSVVLPVFSNETDPFSVDPGSAGTVSIPAGGGSPSFTASTTFAGTAEVCVVGTSCYTILVNGPSASANATFTPRPAPGPCIAVALVDPNDPTGPAPSGVGFGDVQVGATAVSPTTINVSSCTTGNLTQFINAQVGDATSGSGPGQVVWEPGTTTGFGLGPNEFQYAVRLPALPDPIALRNDVVGIATLVSASSSLPVQSELTVGPGSSTGLGEQFSATVTFVATT